MQIEPSKEAIVFTTAECGDATRRVTYGVLRDEVARVSAALRAAGVQQGDVIAGYLPNCIEVSDEALVFA